jgi:hypothetical protein
MPPGPLSVAGEETPTIPNIRSIVKGFEQVFETGGTIDLRAFLGSSR